MDAVSTAYLNAFATLFVTIDPIGLLPIFLGLTAGMSRRDRNDVALRACVIAAGLLLLFTFAGSTILELFGITLPAFRVAGGLLLFAIAIEMVFEKRQERQETQVERATSAEQLRSIAVFPLALPLIAGPSAISATILLTGTLGGAAGIAAVAAMVVAICALTFVVFAASHRLDRILGETGRMILTRLLGVLLAALAVQFVADGVRRLIFEG